MNPTASVIVRSFNRLEALSELLGRLLDQEYEDYEIIVVEQSTEFDQKHWIEISTLAEHPKVKLLTYPPLGGPEARNEGVRNASGDILIFIDDDDLPLDNQWVGEHVEAYNDPNLIGFTGRHLFNGKQKCPYIPWMRWFIRRRCMSYNWLKFPYTFAQFDEDVQDVDWLHGTNSSIRKEWAFKAGLWDTHVVNQDEHSFAFKLKSHLDDHYRLDFRTTPKAIRKMNLGGVWQSENFLSAESLRINISTLPKSFINTILKALFYTLFSYSIFWLRLSKDNQTELLTMSFRR